mgnify:CR=1 FL=1
MTGYGRFNQEHSSPNRNQIASKVQNMDISFSDGKTFHFPCEFLRVHSPSAEVGGHGPGQEVLQTGKKMVNIVKVEPVGHYAIQLHFTDGHNTGLYSWDLLYQYGLNQDSMWQRYLQRMQEAGASREQESPSPNVTHSCNH